MKTFSLTDTGILREMNQDYYFMSETAVGNLPNLFIVADGMGGHKAGDYASRYSTQRVVASIARNPGDQPVTILKEAIEKANELLVIESKEDEPKAGMGTTIVVALYSKNYLLFGNLGDSSGFVVKNHELHKITNDHTLVNLLVKSGELTEEEAKDHPRKNVLMKALGATTSIEMDIFDVETDVDGILLCSDGLTNMLEQDQIMKVLDTDSSVEEKLNKLVIKSNNRGGTDNISIAYLTKDGE